MGHGQLGIAEARVPFLMLVICRYEGGKHSAAPARGLLKGFDDNLKVMGNLTNPQLWTVCSNR
jgi:hypothetical protein